MSLFLGKIHYWVFDKIQHFENIEQTIIKWAGSQGLHLEDRIEQINNLFGEPTQKRPLDELIDNSNIHGWLQSKIESAELRQAALVTEILNINPGFKSDLVSIFEKEGSSSAAKYINTVMLPEDAYKAVNDYILEGMPCDRVTEVISGNEREYVWKVTHCLHKPYWDKVKGDVQNFYDLREAWIRGFVNVLPGFEYVKMPDNTHKIIKS